MYLEMEHSPTVNQIPLNVNEGKAWLASLPAMDQMIKKENGKSTENPKPIIELKDVYYQYEKSSSMVLSKLSLSLKKVIFMRSWEGTVLEKQRC